MIQRYIYEEDERGELRSYVNPDWEIERKDRLLKVMRKYSGIPSEYFDYTFDNIIPTYVKSKASIEKCLKYGTGARDQKFQGVSLYLYGPNSSGKSTAMCATAQEFIKEGLVVKYIHSGRLTTLFTEALQWGEEGVESKAVIKEFDLCDLICLDEPFDPKKSLIYSSGKSDHIVQSYNTWLHHHLDNGRRMIFASNVRLSQISDAFSRDIVALLKRYCEELEFSDNIEHVKKSRREGIWD